MSQDRYARDPWWLRPLDPADPHDAKLLDLADRFAGAIAAVIVWAGLMVLILGLWWFSGR